MEVQAIRKILETLAALLLRGNLIGLIRHDAAQIRHVAQKLGKIACAQDQLDKGARRAARAILVHGQFAHRSAPLDHRFLSLQDFHRHVVDLRLKFVDLLLERIVIGRKRGHAGFGSAQAGMSVVDRFLGGARLGVLVSPREASKRGKARQDNRRQHRSKQKRSARKNPHERTS